MRYQGLIALGTAVAVGFVTYGCSSGNGTATTDGPKVSGSTSPAAQSASTVTAQGSTFIMPFFSKAFDEYKKQSSFQINYTGGGSSAGIRGVTDGVIPFGASDAPMNDAELKKAGKKILNLPLILGAIPVIYNVPGVKSGLKLDGPVLGDIFMVKITKWNDPRIVALNPGVTLPDLPITVQVRADGSGTTYVFSDYLSHVSPDWKQNMGTNKVIKWSDKCYQSKGSDNVANNTKTTAGSISYVELSWATKSGLSYAAIKNAGGQFVSPDAKSTTAAASQVELPADFRVSIVNAPGADSYPISTYSFGLVPEDLTAQASGKNIVGALKYVVGDAQKFAEGLGYAPLPEKVASAVSKALDTVKVK